VTDPVSVERTELAPGYSISRLIHGGWQFSAGHRLGGPALDDALDVLVASAELGVTTFDCADIYTGVEDLYGRLLRRWRSTSVTADLQIHTKLVPDASDLEHVNRAYVQRIVDRSLERLGVEALDLVQLYWWRDEVPGMEQMAVWLTELVQDGKIRHLGATNLSVPRLRRVAEAGVGLVANQVQYSVLDRRPEHRLRGHCASTGMHMIAYGALAGGFLTDRWMGAVPPDRAYSRSHMKYRLVIDEFGGWDSYQTLLGTLADIGRAHGVGVAAVALRFVLEQPHVAAVIAGATRLGQMKRNVEAFRFTLSAEEHARIRCLVDVAPGPSGDVFELESDRDGPHGSIMKYDLNRASPAGATPTDGPWER
jgi:aryl-alcohol dehydrogenase-like predicted oxidoreductase